MPQPLTRQQRAAMARLRTSGNVPHVRTTRGLVPVWLLPHPNGRPGSVQLPTIGHSPRGGRHA